MRLTVHIERVVVNGPAGVSRGALETAIADALRDRLGAGPRRPPGRDPAFDVQVGRAVAPAVLGHAGLDRGAG